MKWWRKFNGKVNSSREIKRQWGRGKVGGREGEFEIRKKITKIWNQFG